MKTKLFVIASLLGASFTTYSQENELPDAGSVGIGTTQPTAKLDVRGSVKIDSTLLVNDSLSVMNSARLGEDLTVMGDAYFKSNANVSVDFNVEGKTSLFKTYMSGPLTMGYAASLQNINGMEILLRDPQTGEIAKTTLVEVYNNLYSKQCYTDNGIVQNPTWMNGPNKIFIDCPEVFVGIGTNTPLHKLDVRGRAYITGGVLAGTYSITGYTNSALYEGIRHQNNNIPLIRLSVRKTDGSNEVRFKVEGDGTVYCTAVKVRIANTIPVPDYVFQPNYYLMPLSEVKAYVKENSHLPNVPSEKEIRQEGLSLEQMQLKLLEKVEELTLYMIELDESNEELKAENAILKAELEKVLAELKSKM